MTILTFALFGTPTAASNRLKLAILTLAFLALMFPMLALATAVAKTMAPLSHCGTLRS